MHWPGTEPFETRGAAVRSSAPACDGGEAVANTFDGAVQTTISRCAWGIDAVGPAGATSAAEGVVALVQAERSSLAARYYQRLSCQKMRYSTGLGSGSGACCDEDLVGAVRLAALSRGAAACFLGING